MASLITDLKQHEAAASLGAMSFPETATHQILTPFAEADQDLTDLAGHKKTWSQLPLIEKVHLLDEALRDFNSLGEAWVQSSLQSKGVLAGGYTEAEEWFIFSAVIRLMRLLRKSLLETADNGHPIPPGKVKTLENGQLSVPAYPISLLERGIFLGHHAETWLEPGIPPEEMFKFSPNGGGRVGLVLGAGNASASPCADMLHFLFVEGDVVALKLSPVNDLLGPYLEQGFQGLIRRGFLKILYGGADLGHYLTEHPLVNHIHLTGSDKTFDRIVFGTGSEGEQRKVSAAARLTRPITAELGCVNPLILVPGEWKDKDYRRAAAMVTTWLSSNAGFNCLNPRLLITQKNWEGRELFLKAFRAELARTPVRPSYYPGSAENRQMFIDAHPDAELYNVHDPLDLADGTIESLPIAFIPGLDPTVFQDVCFTAEPFGMLISETAIEADSPADFLARATKFANERVWGTLSITLLSPPQVERDKSTGAAIQKAAADLRYGTVCLNIFTGLAYTLTATPWGGYPNQPLNNIQSGAGFINNPMGLNRPQKSIFYAPFYRIDPVSIHNRNLIEFCHGYADFQTRPTFARFLKVMWLGIKK